MVVSTDTTLNVLHCPEQWHTHPEKEINKSNRRVGLPPRQGARRLCQAGTIRLQAPTLHRALAPGAGLWKAQVAAARWHHCDPSVLLLLSPGWLVCKIHKKHMRWEEKELQRFFCFHQHETLPVCISFFSPDNLLGSPILWYAQIGVLPLLSSVTGKKCRSDMPGLLATELTGTALKRPPAAKPFTALRRL